MTLLVTTTTARQLSDGDSQGTVLGQSATDKIAFFGATAVAQFVAPGTASRSTVVTGATTAVFTNTTYDGGITGTGYSVGDLVHALKNYGLLPV